MRERDVKVLAFCPCNPLVGPTKILVDRKTKKSEKIAIKQGVMFELSTMFGAVQLFVFDMESASRVIFPVYFTIHSISSGINKE